MAFAGVAVTTGRRSPKSCNASGVGLSSHPAVVPSSTPSTSAVSTRAIAGSPSWQAGRRAIKWYALPAARRTVPDAVRLRPARRPGIYGGSPWIDSLMSHDFAEIRDAVTRLCAHLPGQYWRAKDRTREYPTEFVEALSAAGYLAVLIPEQYGGSGLGVGAASAVLEEIHKSGCNGAACHAQMYTMGTLLKHGSEAQKRAYLPSIAEGKLRLQAFGVTEPTSGTDTTRIRTTAVRDGDVYRVSGQKVFISRTEHSDLMLLLARTTPREQVAKATDGMSVFIVDLREAVGRGLTIKPIATMMNHATTGLFFD